MNNNFQKLAFDFVNFVYDENDKDVESQIKTFIAKQGIDPAWEDELYEQILESIDD
jgi:hypothetical protein